MNITELIYKIRSFIFPKQTIDKVTYGKSVMSSEMINAIDLWSAMHKGLAPWINDDVKSIRIENGIVGEFVNVCLTEIETTVSVDSLNEIYERAIRDLNEHLKDGLALGSLIIKPYGDEGLVEYVTADRFIPTRFDGEGKLTGVIFVDQRKLGEDKFAVRFEEHDLSDGILTITNHAYKSRDGYDIGMEIPLDTVDDWTNLPEEVSYKTDRPVFGYFRSPIKNRIDGNSCGISIYDAAANLIQDADEQYGRLIWEMKGGELAVHVDPVALDPKKRGMDKLSQRLYKSLAIDSKTDGFYNVFSPALRDESILNGLNSILRRIEFTVGLSYGDLSDVSEVAKTATEILMSKQRKFHTVNAIEENLKVCLDDLVYAIAFWTGKTTSGYEFICNFHDSILTDESVELESMREDVAAGIIRPEKYVIRKYGIPEADLAEWIPSMSVAE